MAVLGVRSLPNLPEAFAGEPHLLPIDDAESNPRLVMLPERPTEMGGVPSF